MEIKRVTRYYCEHCRKSMARKDSMERHEDTCFHNPNRSCAICEDDQGPLRLTDFGDILERCEDEDEPDYDNDGSIMKAVIKRADELQDFPCPACICSIVVLFKEHNIFLEYNYKDNLAAYYREINEASGVAGC